MPADPAGQSPSTLDRRARQLTLTVRRSPRIERLTRAIEILAQDQVIDVRRYSRLVVQDCFTQFGARTRYETAVAIATRIPAFERFLPPRRKLWMSEDVRMGIFGAAALALTYYHQVK